MAISRYRNTNILDGKFYETTVFPSEADLENVPTISIRIPQFERLDALAFKHLGSGEYWWVIALINNIEWAFGFEAGDVVKIPVNVEDVLRLF